VVDERRNKMRIVDLEEFRTMPNGTVYMKFQPDIFDELCVKGDTLESDFYCQNLTTDILASGSTEYSEILTQAVNDSNFNFSMDMYVLGRDGCFDEDQLFAVYEEPDLIALIEKLKDSLQGMVCRRHISRINKGE
jgi:hypothetical protein